MTGNLFHLIGDHTNRLQGFKNIVPGVGNDNVTNETQLFIEDEKCSKRRL